MKVKVKTVYKAIHMRPDISEYDSKEEAEEFVKTCKKWGMGIVSCGIIKRRKNK